MTGGTLARRVAALALVPLAAALAAYFALLWIPSVFFGGLVLPSGHDAVYHARRILDAVPAPWAVAQFDPLIHAPGGSWVTWPWGYDALMAAIVRVLRDAAGLDPLRALVFVPPAWLLVNAALLAGISRALRLPPAAQWLVGLCFALSPLTQNLHGLGQVDHHFLEYTCALAVVLAGLHFAGAPDRAAPAAALGAVLGIVNAVHNGLFVLQLPVLAAVGLLWLRRSGPGPRAGAAFGLALVATTLAVALPSDAFRAGFVRYDLLSWFHVHAACLTALAVALLSREPPGWAAAARSAAILVVAAVPLLHEVVSGLGFVTAGVYQDLPMPEMRSPFAGLLAGAFDARWAAANYSGLVLLLPAVLAAAAVTAARTGDARLAFLCVYSLFGGLLLLQQYRFHQFGSVALYVLPLALLLDRVAAPRARRVALLASAGVVALAYWPCLARLQDLPAPGGSRDFVMTRSLYPPLAEACRERPGVVLADHNDGHYVRFFTECAVVANNLVLGPESWGKLHESRRLLDSGPAAVRQQAPWVRYVLVRRDDNVLDPPPPAEVRRQNSALRRALLLDAPPWPAGYRLLAEVRFDAGAGTTAALARLFEVGEAPGPGPACCMPLPPHPRSLRAPGALRRLVLEPAPGKAQAHGDPTG